MHEMGNYVGKPTSDAKRPVSPSPPISVNFLYIYNVKRKTPGRRILYFDNADEAKVVNQRFIPV